MKFGIELNIQCHVLHNIMIKLQDNACCIGY